MTARELPRLLTLVALVGPDDALTLRGRNSEVLKAPVVAGPKVPRGASAVT